MKLASISVAFCLALGLFVFQATGAAALVAASCSQGCPDDDSQGRCADSCTDCACCFHPRPVARATAIAPAVPVRVVRTSPEVPPCYASVPSGEILHVPIAVLA